MEILICDDDINIINQIKELLLMWSKKNRYDLNIATAQSADTIFDNNNHSFDIAFVDIEMPGINGLALSEKLKKTNSDTIVFIITSFQNYLDSAMKIKVFRYLSKPIDANRLINNFNDAIDEYHNICRYITVNYKNSVFKVKTKDILYIQSQKHGSCIETKNDTITTSKKAKDLLEDINLPDSFIHSNASCTVNLQNVIAFDKENVVLRKNENETVSVYMSGRRFSVFKTKFMLYAGDVK